MNITTKIIITDTNIITDLNNANILEEFINLDNVYISDMIKNDEINSKTGNIKLSVILHSLSNLFGSIIIQTLQGISLEIAGMYAMFMMLLAVIGLILFIKNKKKINIDNNNRLLNKTIIKEMFTNKGILLYIAITIIFIISKQFIA